MDKPNEFTFSLVSLQTLCYAAMGVFPWSSAYRPLVLCASGKRLFYGVKSSSSSPGSPGTKADFTPDRNKNLKKTLPTFKMHAQLDLTTFLPCPSCHMLSPYCTLLT